MDMDGKGGAARSGFAAVICLALVLSISPAQAGGSPVSVAEMRERAERSAPPPVGPRRAERMRNATLFNTMTAVTLGGGAVVLALAGGGLTLAFTVGAAAVIIVVFHP